MSGFIEENGIAVLNVAGNRTREKGNKGCKTKVKDVDA